MSLSRGFQKDFKRKFNSKVIKMEDDWDNIDWDEKLVEIVKAKNAEEKVKLKEEEKLRRIVESSGSSMRFNEDDGNYFETNKQKKKIKQEMDQRAREQGMYKASRPSKEEFYLQPYSSKDLERILTFTKDASKFHNLMYETFGQFEKFILTHEQTFTDDLIVGLLIIDVTLLEVPFNEHNELLLKALSKLQSFWSQLVKFIERFLWTNQHVVKFLLLVDMNRFFDNIEVLMHNLLVNNFFNATMEKTFEDIIRHLESFPDSKWSQPGKLRKLQSEYFANLNEFKIYDVS